MDWLIQLFQTQDSVAHIVLLYSIVIALGVYLGKIKIGGISLGVTFVLFVGIIAGHIHFTGPLPVLNFLQDFGLILFVFMIGLQVGPGFFESFGKGGLKLNLLSSAAILLNILVMFACYFIFFDTADDKNLPMMVGTLYGAVTNTPGLGAANEALHSVFKDGMNFDIASGYTCAYPQGKPQGRERQTARGRGGEPERQAAHHVPEGGERLHCRPHAEGNFRVPQP